jgi:hypothetical protein
VLHSLHAFHARGATRLHVKNLFGHREAIL